MPDNCFANPGIPAEYMTRKELARMLGIHPSTVSRWVENNDLPSPVRLGPNRTAWVRDEIEGWRKKKHEAERVQYAPYRA